MIAPKCPHTDSKKFGHDRHGNQRYRCLVCGCTWMEKKPAGPLAPMRIPVETAKTILQLLLEGSSIRSAERITGTHRDTICRLIVRFGDACASLPGPADARPDLDPPAIRRAMDLRCQEAIPPDHHRAGRVCDKGDVYLWTCVDRKTKLMPAFYRQAIGRQRPAVSCGRGQPARVPGRARQRWHLLAAAISRSYRFRPMALQPTPKRLTWPSVPTPSMAC